MKTQKEIILKPDGVIIRRTVSEEEVQAGDSLIKSICDGAFLKAKDVFCAKQGNGAGLCINGEDCYYSVRLTSLPLKCPFELQDGVLFPVFSSTVEPVIPMTWAVPEDMRLVFVMLAQGGFIKNQWLFAFDNEHRAYRLPLSNLYDDARLCIGSMKLEHKTAQDAINAELEQLANGQWNGDLDLRRDESKLMFRFKPVNSGFEQLPPMGNWTELSNKISINILKFVV